MGCRCEDQPSPSLADVDKLVPPAFAGPYSPLSPSKTRGSWIATPTGRTGRQRRNMLRRESSSRMWIDGPIDWLLPEGRIYSHSRSDETSQERGSVPAVSGVTTRWSPVEPAGGWRMDDGRERMRHVRGRNIYDPVSVWLTEGTNTWEQFNVLVLLVTAPKLQSIKIEVSALGTGHRSTLTTYEVDHWQSLSRTITPILNLLLCQACCLPPSNLQMH